MQTNINSKNEVEYVLELQASADDLAEEFNKALREQRKRNTMRGFRPGKVPLSLIKKMHGRAIGEAVAADFVQKVYREQVLDTDEYDVLGQPTISSFEYEFEGDLRANGEFGVRPEFETAELSGQRISRLAHTVTDEEVEKEITSLLEKEADLVPHDGPVEDGLYVVVDMQRVDKESGSPIEGESHQNQAFLLSDPAVMPEMKEALIGKQVDEVARVKMAYTHGEGDDAHEHTDLFDVTVREIKRRELPELDSEFIKSVTKDRIENEAALRSEIRAHLEEAWKRRSKEMFEQEIVERVIDSNPIPVPSSVADMYLDSFVKELEERFKGKPPANFDEEGYRAYRQNDAERQARWMFVRDDIIKKNDFEVTDDERRAHLAALAGDDPSVDVDMLLQYYKVGQGLLEQLDQRLINDKVFGLLEEQFEIEEKDLEAYEEELKERRAEADRLAMASAADEVRETDPADA